MSDTGKRIESEQDVKSYLHSLKYALQHNAKISFQIQRAVDENREQQYTNRFTVADLFPDENPVLALKRELQTLTVAEYMETVRDIRFPKKSEMRVFGKEYQGKGNVYIKIRVELLTGLGNHTAFIMSFHYTEVDFTADRFPYRNKEA